MDVDAALDFAEERFFAHTGERFNDLQKDVFKGAWQGLTYQKIADFLGYSDNHIKDEGARLCQLLSEALGEEVTKLKFRAPLERGWRTQQSRNISSPHPSVLDRIQPLARDPNFVGRENAIASSLKPVSSSAPEEQYYNETCQLGTWIPNTRCRQVWGRENLIEQILNRLNDPQELSILSLTGGAGYGKTEAATKIAQAALNRNLFAYVLWVTARQTELVDGSISQEQRREALNWDKFLHEIAHQLACPVERVQQRLREQ
jgi:hypothetical protein